MCLKTNTFSSHLSLLYLRYINSIISQIKQNVFFTGVQHARQVEMIFYGDWLEPVMFLILALTIWGEN